MRVLQILVLCTFSFVAGAAVDIYIESPVTLLDCGSPREDSQWTIGTTEAKTKITAKPSDPYEFYDAAKGGDLQYIENELSRIGPSGLNLDWQTPDVYRFTALHVASYENQSRIVLALLQAGADPNVQDNIGLTPVHIAARYNNLDVLRLLLDPKYQADVNLADNDGWTPVYRAAANNNLDVLRLLLDPKYQADVNLADNGGWTPVYRAAMNSNLDVLRLLLDPKYQADVNLADNDGQTPVYVAALEGHCDALELLLAQGRGDPNTVTNSGTSPLMKASLEGHTSCVRALLAAGAQVNYIRPRDGRTALHRTALYNNPDVALVLLEAGATKDTEDIYGDTPVDMARSQGYHSLADLIDKY